MRRVRLGDIGWNVARDEGEDFRDVAHWRTEHERYWLGEAYREDLEGWQIPDETLITVEYFEVVKNMTDDQLKLKLEALLGKEITVFSRRWKGAVNDAYYVEAADGAMYVLKRERDDKEFQPRNDLLLEANIIKGLSGLGLSVAVPRVVAVIEDPKAYAYEYVEGVLLKEAWDGMSESERVEACRALGRFHADLGKLVPKAKAEEMGVGINLSVELHPEVAAEYGELAFASGLPESFTGLVRKAKEIFEGNRDRLAFQFLHNDSHPENVIVRDGKVVGIIDFGEAEYGEVAKEFSRYIRDLPDHFQYIVSAYEEHSGKALSRARLLSNAFISGFAEIVEDYRKGGEGRLKAEEAVAKYEALMRDLV